MITFLHHCDCDASLFVYDPDVFWILEGVFVFCSGCMLDLFYCSFNAVVLFALLCD